jgi:hypothetical protein
MLILLKLKGHHPEFYFNTVLNFAMVLAQTIGVKLLMKVSYIKKFELALIPLIIVMIAFPLSI